jgi:hypothetical protein
MAARRRSAAATTTDTTRRDATIRRRESTSSTPKAIFTSTTRRSTSSHYIVEDWVSLGVLLAARLCVFYQFFTRYVLNDSAAWTEEIARYLLMSTVFVGHRRRGPPHAPHSRRLPLPAAARRGGPRAVHRRGRRPHAFFAVAVGSDDPDDDADGRAADDDHRPADELIYGICAFGFARRGALGAGRDRELAARLEPARAARARDRGDIE